MQIAAVRKTKSATQASLLSAVASFAFISAQAQSGASSVDAGNWSAYGHSYDENHFSPLREIDTGNVSRLKLAWYLDLDPMISTFGAPLAVDGVLYFGIGHSVVHAVDAASGQLLWKYDPKVGEVAGEKLRAAHGIRGIAWWKDRVITGTQDGRLIAIDAKTGKPVWSVQTTQGTTDGRYITGAPRVFDDKVIIGHGGADFLPVRGYVTAYDAATGKQLWRFYTVPGDPSKGFEDEAQKVAARTWTGEWWKFGGGGTVWNAMTYDPLYKRIYLGTGNGDPWNQKIRSPGGGDNLYLCSIVALDAQTGKYVWHYQTNPGETWDFNSAMDIELATLELGGKSRNVILHAPKNGFFYVIDRENGKLISAEPFTKVTWASRIDLKTGRPVENPQARFPDGQGVIQPGGTGGHNWEPMAYSPLTRFAYIPTTELPFHYDYQGIDLKHWRATAHLQTNSGYNTLRFKDAPPIAPIPLGNLQAYDPVAQRTVWKVPMSAPYNGGVAVTAGDLVFQGNATGHFVAYDAKTGTIAWDFDAQDGIVGQPISYEVGGHQYITVITGFSGVPAAMGPQVAQYHWDYRTQKRRVLTFKLDGNANLPPPVPFSATANIDDPKLRIEPARLDKGVAVYADRCFHCHGIAAVAAGGAPDLRKSAIPLDAAAFANVVRGGALQSHGMPKYGELTDDDLLALRTFIRYQARKELAPQTAGSN